MENGLHGRGQSLGRAIVSTRETTAHPDDVLRLLLDEGPDLVVKLQDRAELPDFQTLMRSAARLRALATVAGASWLAELCREVELRVRFNELAEIDGLVQRIAIEHARVRSGIRAGDEPRDLIVTSTLHGSLT